MLCSADEAQLMRLLLQLIKAKKTIEIGKDGKIISAIEVSLVLKHATFLQAFLLFSTGPPTGRPVGNSPNASEWFKQCNSLIMTC